MNTRRLRKFILITGTTLIVLIAAALVWAGTTRRIRFAVPLVNTFAIVVVLTLLVWVWPKRGSERSFIESVIISLERIHAGPGSNSHRNPLRDRMWRLMHAEHL